MSPALQTKLLRALEERAFLRVGGTETIRVDVRFIAATNRDLEQAISEGRFREDLYYRLNVVDIRVPPLRERLGDVPLLVDHFLHELAEARGRAARRLEPDALEALMRYGFPGNVRELQNIIERAYIMTDGDSLGVADLPLPERQEAKPRLEQFVPTLENGWIRLQQVVKELERQLIERTLAVYAERPNAELAQLLGTSRRVLELRLQEFGINKRGKS